MKPRNREINIFNLSMMDVIAGALGAFLILFLLLQPYYGKTSKAPSAPPAKNLREAQQQVEDLRAAVKRLESKLDEHNSINFSLDLGVGDIDLDLWVYQVGNGEWNGPKGKKLFGKIEPSFSFTDLRAGRSFYSENLHVNINPTGIYVVAANWADGGAAIPQNSVIPSALSITKGYRDGGAISRTFPFPLPARGAAEVVAVVLVVRDNFAVIEVREPWQGGDFPPKTREAIKQMQESIGATR